MLLRALDGEARAAGGAVIMINGNHEEWNLDLDFRCIRGCYPDCYCLDVPLAG